MQVARLYVRAASVAAAIAVRRRHGPLVFTKNNYLVFINSVNRIILSDLKILWYFF